MFRVAGPGLRAPGLVFGESGFTVVVEGLMIWFRVSGLGFRVSGSVFRVSGFGFQVSDFWLSVEYSVLGVQGKC